MNHKERISAVLAGEVPDRLPVSVWGHDFLKEWSAEDLANQTIEKYRAYDYDFIKINPRWTMFAEPWGNKYVPPTEQRFPDIDHLIISAIEDFSKIPQVASSHPVFGEHEEAVRMVVDEIGEEVDCIATVFSPLAALGLMAGGVGKPLLQYLPEASDSFHESLGHITQTLKDHAINLLDAGASGVFYAPLQWTSQNVCPADTYAEFGEPYDRELLGALADAPFNMMHVCGNNIGLSRFYDYPVAVLNWDNFGDGNPTLVEASAQCKKVIAGGIPHKSIHKLDAQQLEEQAKAATAGVSSNLMLAGGCAIGALVSDGPRKSVVSIADNLSRPSQ